MRDDTIYRKPDVIRRLVVAKRPKSRCGFGIPRYNFATTLTCRQHFALQISEHETTTSSVDANLRVIEADLVGPGLCCAQIVLIHTTYGEVMTKSPVETHICNANPCASPTSDM